MPTIQDLSSKNITAGPASSVKTGATNYRKKANEIKAKQLAEGKATSVPENGCKYRNPNNSFSCGGVTFHGTYYTTADAKELRILDDAVARKLLYIVEDNRK